MMLPEMGATEAQLGLAFEVESSHLVWISSSSCLRTVLSLRDKDEFVEGARRFRCTMTKKLLLKLV